MKKLVSILIAMIIIATIAIIPASAKLADGIVDENGEAIITLDNTKIKFVAGGNKDLEGCKVVIETIYRDENPDAYDKIQNTLDEHIGRALYFIKIGVYTEDGRELQLKEPFSIEIPLEEDVDFVSSEVDVVIPYEKITNEEGVQCVRLGLRDTAPIAVVSQVEKMEKPPVTGTGTAINKAPTNTWLYVAIAELVVIIALVVAFVVKTRKPNTKSE